MTLRASATLTPSGFSEWTCLPALRMARLTSVWASGTVRLTTISTSSRFSSWSTRIAGTPNAAACFSAAALRMSATARSSRLPKRCAALR